MDTQSETNVPITPNSSSVYNSKVVILIGIVIFVGIVGFFGYYLGSRTTQKKQTNQVSNINTPTPSISVPTNNTEVTDWKTYSNAAYIFKYPASWYVNQYLGSSNFAYSVEVSDVQDSITTIKGMSDTHTRIDISIKANPLPASFPYTNGSSTNSTIRSFSVNGLTGIRGMQTGEVGLTDTVYLANPKGGHVEILFIQPTQNVQATQKIFDTLLSSFSLNNTFISPTNLVSPTKIQTKTIIIPSDWNTYSDKDPEFKVQTSGYMPSTFSFHFTGSETLISNADASEVWEYKTSVFGGNQGIKNYYDGSSRRAWYQKYLNGDFGPNASDVFKKAQILSVKEKFIEQSSYLEVTVDVPGIGQQRHYLYVQNGILNFIIPANTVANSTAAKLPQYMDGIFYTMKVSLY